MLDKYIIICVLLSSNYICFVKMSSSNEELQWLPDIVEIVGSDGEMLLCSILMSSVAFYAFMYIRDR